VDELLQKHRLQPIHSNFGSLTLLKEPQLIAARGLREEIIGVDSDGYMMMPETSVIHFVQPTGR